MELAEVFGMRRPALGSIELKTQTRLEIGVVDRVVHRA
jgi:hypothetical protein